MEVVMVLDCKACGAKISKLSEKCINCGHPNEWVSPEIVNFLKIKDVIETPSAFTFTRDKVILNCDSRGGYPVWYWVLLLALLFGSFTLTIMLSFVLGVVLTLVAGGIQDEESAGA
ncbi:hypothetical protein [Pseudomonas sp. TMP25]|uniref:hypothetical protein n=1 Tax=Pseudomonas sp. TMP25 TaxID=3136561 RepID=UPI0031017211